MYILFTMEKICCAGAKHISIPFLPISKGYQNNLRQDAPLLA
jgi:hypothetical protein